ANVLVATNCDGTTTDDTGIVITDTTQPNFGCKAIIASLGSSGGLTDSTPQFRTVVRFFDQSNQYMKAMICWQRPKTCNGTGLGCVTGPNNMSVNTLEFGQPILDTTPNTGTGSTWLSGGGCDTPAPSSAPLLLYFQCDSSTSCDPAVRGFR